MNYSAAALEVEATEMESANGWDWAVEPTSHKSSVGDRLEYLPIYRDQDQKQVEQKFRELAERWNEEVLNLSSLTEILSHEAYLAIIALGRPVLPFLFSELEREPNLWFTAISSILEASDEKADVVVDESSHGNIQRIADDWLEWARNRGYLG